MTATELKLLNLLFELVHLAPSPSDRENYFRPVENTDSCKNETVLVTVCLYFRPISPSEELGYCRRIRFVLLKFSHVCI